MGGYYTFAEIESVLDQLTAAYPQFVSPKTSIGQTLEGREIWMVKISDNADIDENEPEVRFDAMHHAREPEGMQATDFEWFANSLLVSPLVREWWRQQLERGSFGAGFREQAVDGGVIRHHVRAHRGDTDGTPTGFEGGAHGFQ